MTRLVVRSVQALQGMRAFRHPASGRRSARGFTLVELMVVVAIMGILATLGITATRRYMDSSHSTEALSTIQAIRGGQEQWRAHTQSYFNVSTTMAASWYPMAAPGATRYQWERTTGADYANWQLLRPPVEWPVRFGYTTVAGQAGTAIGALGTITANPGWGIPDQPWYVVQAKADLDTDGTPAYFVASSMTSEIYSENAGE